MPVSLYKNFSWVDLTTNGWMEIERTSGKHWKELPDDYMVPAAGPDHSVFCIIIGGGDEEVSEQMGSGQGGANSAFSIDAWM